MRAHAIRSHFGWIREAAILRSLTIAGQGIPAAAVAELLRQLLDSGWAEQRHSDADAGGPAAIGRSS
ncbi:MAG: hypothetical protein WBP81_22620 [Solirubrobacteraceae bacterium]